MTPKAAAEAARTAGRILLGGCTADPVDVLDAVAADPELWQGITLTGAFIPGVNDRDYSALGRNGTVETIFVTSGLRADRAAGRVAHLPMHYSAFHKRLARPGVVDLVILTVPPPQDGSIGLGLCADFAPAAIAAGARLIGMVNPQLPDTPGAPRIPVARFEALAESSAALPELKSTSPDTINRQIAQRIAGLVPEGGTLQLGLGTLQAAVLEAVQGRHDLGFHGGMISDGVLDAAEDGGFRRGITTGVALGTRGFYDRLGTADGIRFGPVDQTHAISVLSGIPGLTCVNSGLEVDLTGQVNVEYLNGNQSSGQGGMIDFIRGARASEGGVAIMALPSTAKRGTVSRIVPQLAQGTPVSVARSDIDVVVTEHGVADLREADMDTRRARLIAVADPAFRDDLMRAGQ
ncbi:acetyl-CoA hydrolase/transferase family protein [Flavimaricola marinus]|uniref:Propionyl-CoA:succinate CoA transferase n=1 Tax=Flavimaricola marinus TaxID=1819565 RepID=A0A238LEU0_9RHOB|nr:acetyl-CoA hydrolase/transferase C-terminal domain-containing protein [Flavimaricola marinus]SMY08151.1 Propionyl-CoA:succinate CoA transferase [Flavimaricola marinus]